jgi:molybdate transport repressor ModE-like protein
MSNTPPVNQLLNRLRMRQVALLLAIGEHGTLRKASAELGMTQPAATKMVHELESALGQKLFERMGRGQRLSPAGTSVLRYFRGIRGTFESMGRELAELQLGSAGRLSIGSIMAPTQTLLTQAIVALKNAFPLLSVEVRVETSDRLHELLQEGVLDIALGRMRDANRGDDYLFDPLDNETLAIVVGVGHPLGNKKIVRFSDLVDYPWILQPPGSPMREVLEQEFRIWHTSPPKGLIETASILITMNLISQTHMVGVMPLSIADNYAKHGLLTILPCKIKHKMEAFGSITRKDRPLSEAGVHFLSTLHQCDYRQRYQNLS